MIQAGEGFNGIVHILETTLEKGLIQVLRKNRYYNALEINGYSSAKSIYES